MGFRPFPGAGVVVLVPGVTVVDLHPIQEIWVPGRKAGAAGVGLEQQRPIFLAGAVCLLLGVTVECRMLVYKISAYAIDQEVLLSPGNTAFHTENDLKPSLFPGLLCLVKALQVAGYPVPWGTGKRL